MRVNSLSMAEPKRSRPRKLPGRRCQSKAAIARLDHQSADTALGEAAALLPAPKFLAEVVQPLLTHVGDVWSQQRLGIAIEHLTTSLLWLGSHEATLVPTAQLPQRLTPFNSLQALDRQLERQLI